MLDQEKRKGNIEMLCLLSDNESSTPDKPRHEKEIPAKLNRRRKYTKRISVKKKAVKGRKILQAT